MNPSEENPMIAVKSVDDVFVASVQFIGQTSEIPACITRLRAQVGEHIVGDPLCLFDVTAQEDPHQNHIEVCYPVDKLIDERVHTRILPGCEVVSATWRGPAGTPWGRTEWWKSLRPYVRNNYLTLDEDPIREIRHLEGNMEIIEVQYTLQFPRWLQGLESGLSHYAGEKARQQVMEGRQHLKVDAPIEERLGWICAALERLDQVVEDHPTRCQIMNGCAHRFPRPRIEKLRAFYQETVDIDALLEVMRADTSVGGASWYAHPVREGNIIHNYNDPADPQGYQQAQTELDQRIASCFCPIGQAALRAGINLSHTFCNCSAGYTRQLWEGIFQQPVRVEIVDSVLRGDPRCRFEIYLPDGCVKAG